QPSAVGAEVRPAQHRRTAGAAGDTAVGVQQVVDLDEPGVDADELGAALGEEVLAEASPPVQLDEEAAEVAQLLLADLQQRALFATELPGVRPPRSDALRTGAAATRSPPTTRPHGWSVRLVPAPTLPGRA